MVRPARIVTVSHLPTVQWMFDEIEPLLGQQPVMRWCHTAPRLRSTLIRPR